MLRRGTTSLITNLAFVPYGVIEHDTDANLNQDTYMVQILDFSKGLQSLSRSDFKDFGIDRSSAMPSYKGKLTEAELDDLVSYLLSLTRQAGLQKRSPAGRPQ